MSETKKNPGFQLPTPGPELGLIEPFVGKFRSAVEIYMGKPEPITSTGTMTNSWQVDGLYLHQDYVGDPVPAPHSAFVGRGYWGYNPGKKLYEGFWIDNVSSMMQTETGSVDGDGKVWTMTSEVDHPAAGKMKKRSVIRVDDRDHHSMESFMTAPDGSEFRTMVIRYSRA